MQHSREQRVHWNAATPYPHLEAHLLDLVEEWTPLPTVLCSLVLSFLVCGSALRSCLPLPHGHALLEVSKNNRRGSVQLREGCAAVSYELPFRGGGYLYIRGPLFKRGRRSVAEKPAWHVLRTAVDLRDRPLARQIKYYSDRLIDASSEERPRKKRRIQQQQEARRIIHQQSFAYYQVLPAGCGVNLLHDPSSVDTLGLVSGVCLLYAHRREYDPVEGSALFSIEAARQTPLSGADHTVSAYFRPRGVCEWNGGRCNRHASAGCVNSCCTAAHCIASTPTRWQSCNAHTL